MEAMKTAEKLQITLGDRRMSQATLARHIGISQPWVNQIINEKGELSARQAFAISKVLDVSLDWLMDEEDDSPIPPVPSDRERQVREIAARHGWDRVYWSLVDANLGGQVQTGTHRDPVTGDEIPKGSERPRKGRTG